MRISVSPKSSKIESPWPTSMKYILSSPGVASALGIGLVGLELGVAVGAGAVGLGVDWAKQLTNDRTRQVIMTIANFFIFPIELGGLDSQS